MNENIFTVRAKRFRCTEVFFQSRFQPVESTLLSSINDVARSYGPRLNFVLAVLMAPFEIYFSARRAHIRSTLCAISVPVDLKHCASSGFAFLNLLNPDQDNFEDVPFGMPGRVCQDVRVTQCNKGCT